LEKWAKQHDIERRFIQPGRPMQNGLIERFNRTHREEVLDCYVFETLNEARLMTSDWMTDTTNCGPMASRTEGWVELQAGGYAYGSAGCASAFFSWSVGSGLFRQRRR
jgi:transposase InsO family protein